MLTRSTLATANASLVAERAARKKTEDDVVQGAAYLESLVESIGSPVIVANASQKFEVFNSSASTLLGLGPLEISMDEWTDAYGVYLPDTVTRFPEDELPLAQALRGHSTDNVEMFIRNASIPDGCFLSVTGRPLVVKGSHEGAVVVFHDITPLRSAQNTLRDAASALERSNQDLEDFAYIVSHDLKQPLRGIRNYAAFLLEDYESRLDSDGQEKLRTLGRLARQIDSQIETLLHYSRAGRSELAVRPTDMNLIVDEVLEQLSITQKEERIEVVVHKPLPTIVCDGVRVREVLHNLITNAMKYNDKPEKRIEIGVRPGGSDEETESANRDGRPYPVFYVRDNGIGIREKHLDTIFKVFKRLHGQGQFGGGTGAGLTIAQKLIERHGGKIWAESVLGEGTTFYFTLPGKHGSDEEDDIDADASQSERRRVENRGTRPCEHLVTN